MKMYSRFQQMAFLWSISTFVLYLFSRIAQVKGGRVTGISPLSGSVRGATRLTIFGEGFADSQFNYYRPELGNNVKLVSVTGTHALACDVIPYYTTRQQIVCNTRPSQFGFGAYNVRVQVDGVLLRSVKGSTYCTGECVFKYADNATPTITSVSPRSALPGSVITIRGKIFTDQYVEAEGTKSDGESILRVFAGSGLCEPLNQETKEVYGIAFDRYSTSSGYIQCKTSSTFVGSHRVSYIVSKYGRSLMSKDALLVDSQDKLYMFQAYADVTSVSPTQGSTAGGTIVTIKGKGFEGNNTQVEIGGLPCRVLSVTSNTITCQTGQGFDFLSSTDFYPGNRGILREVWTSTKASDLSSIANLDSSASDYHSEVLRDASSPPKPSFGENTMFSSRLRGFFVAPSDNNYTFFLQADDKAELYLSGDSQATKKRKVASCPAAATIWTKYPEQQSAVFFLKAGHAYYMEAYHIQTRGSSHVRIGVKLEKTRYVTSQIGSAVNEKQVFRVLSTERPETQIINITNWDSGLTYEMQRVSVAPNCTTANKSICSEQFQLSYSGHKTIILSWHSTAEEVQSALNNLKPITQQGNVRVTQDNLNGASNYNVTFVFALPSQTKALGWSLVSNGATVNIAQTKKGQNGNWNFRFSLGKRISDYIRVNSSESDVKSALRSMLSWQCSYQIPIGRAWYYNGFESKALGPEFGERVVDERPFCGRASLRKPTYIFRADQTRSLGGRVLGGIDVSKYRQLCFAYKGNFKPYLNFYVSYTDRSGNGHRVWRKYGFTPVTTTKWHYHCMGIHDNMYSDSYLNARANEGYGYYVDAIKVPGDVNTDIYIDDIIIWRDSVNVLRHQPAAEPGSHVIKSFDVRQLGPAVWAIYLTPAHCGTDLEMIEIVDAQKDTSNTFADVITYRPVNQTEAIVAITRVQRATPPVGGTFDLTFKGQRYFGIPSNISAGELKSKLENNLDIGQINVTRIGTCAGYNWTIEWATSGGNQPDIEVDGSGLTGNDVLATTETLDDGGMFLRPIPGDMLRIAEHQPQVSVKVNNVPSSCSTRKCSFLYSSRSTPILTAINPNKGQQGTTLQLTGRRFSTNARDNNVTIGGTSCHVTGSTATTITCTAGQYVGGLNDVNVKVTTLGFAKHVNGHVIFVQEVIVTKVTPNTGSVAGGTILSITGSGFSLNASQMTVALGTSNCKVVNSSWSRIVCVTSEHFESKEDLRVKVRGQVAFLGNAFQFDRTKTPIVTSIGPRTQSVYGGAELVISGRNLGTRGTVLIGKKPCEILMHLPPLIKCSIPAHASGIYDVIINVEGQGYASYQGASPRFEYVLEVTDVYPRHGSVFGGTLVTIRGRGFSTFGGLNTSVTMGDVPCTVVSKRSDQIMCKTTDSSVTHYVDNSGIHPEYGLGYAWNPHTLTISSGDTVKWRWSSPEMTNLQYGVQQTNDPSSTAYNGRGFKSKRSGTGWFQHRFTVPGTYYYSSGAVDPYDVINMKGKIVVTGPRSKTTNVTVQVGNFTAVHNLTQIVPPLPSTLNCRTGITSDIAQCNPPVPTSQYSSFVFRECSTPEVTSLSPYIGISSSKLTIRGRGLGSSPCYSEVTIGSQQCVILASSSDIITCRVTTGSVLTAGVPYDVNVRVNNRGNAWFKSDDVESMRFTLLPTVTSVSPWLGSLAGGTLVTISGDGFSQALGLNIVKIGPTDCTIVSSSPSEIKCITQAHSDSKTLNVSVTVNDEKSICVSHQGCTFTFSDSSTPRIDYVTPDSILGDHNVINFYGTDLVANTNDITIKFGNESCKVLASTQYAMLCSIGTVVAGSHLISVHIEPKGYALLDLDATKAIVSLALVSDISPTEGSEYGGTELTITGNGFDPRPGQTDVLIGGNRCGISSVTNSKITCTTSAHRAGSFEVDLTSGGKLFPGLRFAYRSFLTPRISSIFPTKAMSGDTLTITGRAFGNDPAQISVTIGNSTCKAHSVAGGRIMCVLEDHPAGVYDVVVHVKRKGFSGYSSNRPIRLTYGISIVSASIQECGLGGGRIMSLQGQGYGAATVVKICDSVCNIKGVVSARLVRCEVPPYQGNTTKDVTCPLVVYGTDGVGASKPGFFTYRVAMTSRITSVSPSRGGTGGGVTVTITGSGFSSTSGGNQVTIAGTTCTVTSFSNTQITCLTGQRRGFVRTKVRVEVEDQGVSTMDQADFEYIDVWSSRYSWRYKDPPIRGDLVVIPKGQTMLLDVSTPVFAALVIKGKLIFDEKDIVLNAEKVILVDGGVLEVGTESKPFQHKARIVLHGHPRSVELPLFGAKVLAVREGTLDLHGKHVPITWTHLLKTADIGATQLLLKQTVSWNVGDNIVLASTSRHPGENEELMITSVSGDGRTIGIKPPLKHKHISITQTIAGKIIETRAEVGLLTRNVVVEGSVQREWTDSIQKCSEDFDPDQFATQSCFNGRYKDEESSDQFGSQIMLNAKEMNKGLVTGRISYIEVRQAGQAFKLGRYPIHFHMSGDVTGSYVRGCAIHHTFNRAVTIHGVHGLLVEHNIAYHVMGHAYFIEDGIETGNTIQYNLGVYVTSSSSLLNVDVTPGTFWITNPNNTVRHNTAAAGSHFGFWYNMPVHPGGPSYTPTVWPRKTPLGEFRNNTAHSFGRYGLWIFPTYIPLLTPSSSSDSTVPAKFQDFVAYNNLKGFEMNEVGAVQAVNCTMLDNKEAGFEVTIVQAPWSATRGGAIRDSLVVGYSAVSANDPSDCTLGGVVGPQSSRLTLSGVTFVNFDASKCASLRGCSFCRPNQGGWAVHLEKTKFIRAPNKAGFLWQHETVYQDLDGTLTGFAGGSIVATNENLSPQHCTQSPSASLGDVPGSICDASLKFRRFAWNKPLPTSLLYKDACLTNQYGTSRVLWASMRLTHKNGWMATVIAGENYNLTFDNAQQLSNISYSGRFYEFEKDDYVLITHPMKYNPDIIRTTGKTVNMSSGIPQPKHASTGDWYYSNATKDMTYIVTGDSNGGLVNRDIKLQVIRCFYKNCIKPIPPPPPEKRPLQYLKWSDPESWYGTEQGYGGFNKKLPVDGDDVMIKQGWWMVADTKLPTIRKLLIHGTLELEPTMDFQLNATYIFVAPDANLIIGWPDQPMSGRVVISLHGDWDTPEMIFQDAPSIGAKTMAIFGNLEVHGQNQTTYWTQFDRTADAGAKEIRVKERVEWTQGDEIVIAPTSYRAHETEVMTIESVSADGKTIYLANQLNHKHLGMTTTIGSRNVTLAAEVGLLTRNIVIEGAGDVTGLQEKQLFGCRVLVSSVRGSHQRTERRIRIENVEFRYCGQEGWSDYYDPRYSLAFLDIPSLSSSSFVRGNSFHHGYNTGLGVFGVNGLLIQDNIVHRSVGSSFRITGSRHTLLHNLAVFSVSPATFNGRLESMNMLWHSSFELNRADDIIIRDNTAAGSERIGFHIRGEKCYTADPENTWLRNSAHSCLHGVHIGYTDGYPGCAKVAHFLSWKNWDYGIFGYPSSRVMVEDCILADNKAGVLINVYAPPSLSHFTADKFVQLDRILIIGTSPAFDCSVDTRGPINALITAKARGPRTKGGGHIGLVLSTFSSGPGLAPEFPWNMIESYPAINGITKINTITFSSFGTECGKRSVAIMTNPLSPDAMHPTEIRGLSLHAMKKANLVLLEPPKLGWVNPSDCVDMDCDGHKEVLITDMDGSMTGTAGGTVISKAEYEWNGDPRRGLGDYRIPKAMLTGKDGSRLNASVVAPHHGIVRGNRTKSFCKWIVEWNAYSCANIDYEMIVIESMDADTEVRRLSPVALSADGYTNLLNGPQDHGWCFGYTCQERISTFYAIVATGRNYTLYFTGTNPEKLRLRLLHSEPNQVLRLSIWYSKPGRLDVYSKGQYVYPTNTNLKDSGFTLKKKDPRLPDDQFEPPLTGISGSNYFDNELKMLMVVVRGGNPVDIRTMPIIQVTLSTKPVHVSDFFEKNLIMNLAALLNIDRSRIRVVEIVNAAGPSRRRRAVPQDATMKIKLEISNLPPSLIPYKPEERYDESTTSGPSTSPPTSTTPPPYPDVTSYSELEQLSSKIVEAAQTKKMSDTLKLDVLSIDVVDPEPPRVDPTGGVRATNETGGPSNGTWRYDQVMEWKEGNRTIPEHDYLIPAKLLVNQNPEDVNETVVFGLHPKLVVLDAFNRTVRTLGHGKDSKWLITASIRPGTGKQGALLYGNTTIPFINGWANFTRLYITHSAKGYIIDFIITSPTSANISASSETFDVKERVLYFTLTSSPSEANETVPFVPQPVVEVRDAANGELVRNTGWKGRKWLCDVILENPRNNQGYLNGSTNIEFTSGVARFTNLSIDYAGSGYILSINAYTVPASRYSYRVSTNPFDVKERQLQLVIVQQPGDCNDTVTCGFQPIVEIQDLATNRPIDNVGWRGRKWTVLATMVNGVGSSQLNGTTLHAVPKTGRVEYSDLKFSDVAIGYQMKFQVTTSPYSASYSQLTATSERFDVQQRTFYLHVLTQPGLINASEVFGQQPVVEVRDVGTRARATPLKTTWMVTASLLSNPKPERSFLKGNQTILVERERARFTNLMITEYGEGYVLSFESDSGGRVLSDRFQVHYVNDYSPEFIPNNATQTASASEGVSIGIFILTVSASDKDKGSQGIVSYSIHSGNIGYAFSIDKHSGNITTRKPLDRETIASYNLIVRASDEAVTEKIRFAEMKVVVIVTDLNDNAPVFETSPFKANVTETALPGHVIVRVMASDPDEGRNGEVRFSITQGNSDGYFSIDEKSGDITVKKVLDLESQSPPMLRYTLVVMATDRGTPISLHNTSSVIINVTPVNEFTPYFTHSTSQDINIKENVSVGDSGLELVDVNATDKDYGIQGQVTYSIASGNKGGRFNISSSTGEIKLTKPLDYEQTQNYTLVVRATDGGSGGAAEHADFTLRVHVKDVNDNKPVFASSLNAVNIPETLGVGQIAFVVKATDADSTSNGLVSFDVQTGNDEGYFQLNSKTGEVKLMKSLDLESLQERNWNRTLRISASDHGIPQLTSSAEFECRVMSVNEYSPFFVSKPLSLQLIENINIGTMIGQVSARDKDFGPDGQIRYTIVSGNRERKFRVNRASGKIFINAPLDREHTAQFTLKIQAGDSPLNPTSQRRSWTHVDIRVEDTNDNKPTFNRKSYYAWVKETAHTGSDVITVQASDPDLGLNGEIRYSISSGNTHGFFAIDNTTGIIKVQQSLDLETQKHVDDLIYVLTIHATDKGSPNPLSNSVIVTIEIKSVNEFTPRLLHSSPLYVRIPHTTGIGTLVVTINGTDADFGSDGTLNYQIIKGNSDHIFSIDNTTGEVTVAKQLDYGILPRSFLSVRVSDQPSNGLSRSVVAKVTVRLTTPNDTGGTDIGFLGLCHHLTTPGNVARSAGVPVSCNFSIGILRLGELSEVLPLDDKRVHIDDKTLSRGLFSVVKGDQKWIIQANTAGHLGQGAFVVLVEGVYSIHVKMDVVGYQSLNVKASLVSPYAIIVNHIQRVGHKGGSFKEADLILQMKMTDNTYRDLRHVTTTSYHVTNNDLGVVAKVGPSPPNRLRIDRTSSPGRFSVYAKMGNLTSPKIILHVMDSVVTPVEIVSVDIPSLVNETLLGATGTATGRLHVTMVMSDSTLLTFDDIEEYSNLIQFDCQPGIGASVNQKGLVTLKQDSSHPERVTAKSKNMANDYMSLEFFCNTQPPSGEIDIGNLTGPAIMDYNKPIPIHINATGFTLLAYNITIEYDATTLQFKGLKENIPFSFGRGRISLLNVVTFGNSNPSDVTDGAKSVNSDLSYVTSLVFSKQSGANPFIKVSSSTVLDVALAIRSKHKTRYCPSSLSNQLGDVDSKCGLDVYDAAITMMCAKNMDDEKCRNNEIKHKMDFNLNGIIEESDASLLLRAAVDQVRFVASIQINRPDYKNKTSQCALSIITSLVNRDGTPGSPSDTRVYFEFSSKEETLRDQIRGTVFVEGEIVEVYDGQSGLWGGVVKAEPTGNGVFQVKALESSFELQDLGVSMIQVTQHSLQPSPSIIPLFDISRNPIYNAKIDVLLAPNARLLVTKGHSPQLLVNIDQSTSTCKNPNITKTIEMKFQNDFSSVEGRREDFIKVFQNDLDPWSYHVTIATFKLSPGSIKVNFAASGRLSALNPFIARIWSMLQSGYSLEVDGITFVALKELIIDGEEYQKPEVKPSTSAFPVSTVLAVCVSLVILFAVVGAFVFFRKRKLRKGNGSAKWMRIKKMSSIHSRSNLSLNEFPEGNEMAFINRTFPERSDDEMSREGEAPSNQIPGTPEISGMRTPIRVGSAMSRDSVEAWCEEEQESPRPYSKKGRRSTAGNGKVSPAPHPTRSTSPKIKLITKQNSTTRLIGDETDSDGSVPSSPEEVPTPPSRNNRKVILEGNVNVAKILLDHDEGRKSPSRGQKRRLKEQLHRQSSDSQLIELRRENDRDGFPFTRPKLYKKATWAGGASPRSLSPQLSSSSLPGLPESTDSSPPDSGSVTPQGDLRTVTPSSINMRSIPLKDDLTIEDEPFTVRLPVNILNTSRETSLGPFAKLGFIETQTDSTLANVRRKIIHRFDLKGRFFVFEDVQMMDIEPSREDDVIVGDTFSVSIIIKMIENQDEIKKLSCICDKVAQFQCSACYRRGYCDRDCQVRDWANHKKECVQNPVSAV